MGRAIAHRDQPQAGGRRREEEGADDDDRRADGVHVDQRVDRAVLRRAVIHRDRHHDGRHDHEDHKRHDRERRVEDGTGQPLQQRPMAGRVPLAPHVAGLAFRHVHCHFVTGSLGYGLGVLGGLFLLLELGLLVVGIDHAALRDPCPDAAQEPGDEILQRERGQERQRHGPCHLPDERPARLGRGAVVPPSLGRSIVEKRGHRTTQAAAELPRPMTGIARQLRSKTHCSSATWRAR